MRRPLSVVGTDQEALRALLALHACPEPRILDVTHNRGRMWKGLPYAPHRSDRDPTLHEQGFTDTVADFRSLPFPDASFDVIVFDPPHLDHATPQAGPCSHRSRSHEEALFDVRGLQGREPLLATEQACRWARLLVQVVSARLAVQLPRD